MSAIRSLLLFGLLGCCGGAWSQAYPDRAITLVVPFAASGPLDMLARTVLVAMGKHLHQQVLIENVAGAGGTVGASQVAQSEPDGYTLLISHIGMASAPALHRNLPYDPLRDFEPVGEITDIPMTLVGRADFPARNFKELVTYMKANPGRVRLAHAGPGSAAHLCGLKITTAAEVEVQTVAYKGTGPGMDDLLAGKVDLMCDMSTSATLQINAGKIKSFGVTTSRRLASLPNVPTMQENGLKGFDLVAWHAFFLPRGTPRPVVDKVVEALQAALQDAGVNALFKDMGTEPAPLAKATPQYLRKHLSEEIDRWAVLIKRSGDYASTGAPAEPRGSMQR